MQEFANRWEKFLQRVCVVENALEYIEHAGICLEEPGVVTLNRFILQAEHKRQRIVFS